ncbi:MAG: MTAP family purine nucleoside phosphorylase [Desulfurispora sp.]|uniref:MTAP family purine nucleoside phosphorylase n=1 Tax=Desulfurispora sp. TaxID=3014275 RepID=UPI00404A89AA
MVQIPAVKYALIGGSSTFSLQFPEDLNGEGYAVQVLARDLVYQTPFGASPPFKHFRLGDKEFLHVKMHGWRPGVSRADASRQVFWVLQQAGVKKIMAEGGVGSINHLLELRDVLVPSDYLDFSMRKDVSLGSTHLLVMRQPVCPQITALLYEVARRQYHEGRVFSRGVYAVTDGRHFESVAEVQMLSRLGADMVGQSMCPEVYLAREISACYGRIDLVVNYAEGVVRQWTHAELAHIFRNSARQIAGLLLAAAQQLDDSQQCGCPDLRHETLLKEK